MMAARQIQIAIMADTRQFRRSLIACKLLMEQSFWRRCALRIARWRIGREKP